MTLRQFAFNNVMRNSRIYAGYFLSSAFSVMVFFVYSMFAVHPSLSGNEIHKHVTSTMHFAAAVIYVFSFFFVLYSMSAFLKSRKQEFGVLIMFGMTNMQLRRMVFLENMLIGLGATGFGVLIGLVFSKLILLLAENVLRMEEGLPFYVPGAAIGLTFGAFTLLFLAISLFTVTILRGNKLIELIKGTAKPKPEPKASAFLSWSALLLLAGAYTVALIVKGILVVTALIPVTLVTILGTYLLFTQLSVYVIRKVRANRALFWRRTNLVLFSDLAYRMKDNARTFFMVSILSTVAFSAVGSLVGFKSMYTELIMEENPFRISYQAAGSYSEEEVQRHLAEIEQVLQEEGITYQILEAELPLVSFEGRSRDTALISASTYNRFAAALGKTLAEPKGKQVTIAYYTNAYTDMKPDMSEVMLKGTQLKLEPIQSIPSSVLPLYQPYYVVEDSYYEELLAQAALQTKPERYYAYDLKAPRGSLRELNGMLAERLKLDDKNFTYRLKNLDVLLYELDQMYGAVLFIGFFIGIVFFVGAGSFLYFRLYTDLEEDKRKFKAIRKLGLNDKELSGILTKQVMILFFIPMLVALVHGAVALTALQNMFGYSLVKESATVLGAFALIQTAYFFLIRTRYIANVKQA